VQEMVLNTTIGEGGLKVSSGENNVYRLLELLRQPRLLLFDEATSALDSITEEEITKTIRNSSKRQITVLIAHQTLNNSTPTKYLCSNKKNNRARKARRPIRGKKACITQCETTN
jgi:ABC-type transport system involved in cytochrome bd biosynthesis fused ATPase/permease subunit